MKIIFPTRGSISRYPKGQLIQGFKENYQLYMGAIGMPGHNGWDVVPVKGYGEDILAPHDGYIFYTKYDGQGYGNHVALASPDENGDVLLSLLGHLTADQVVKMNDEVKAGDIIGHMGNSGFVVSKGVSYWGQANPDKRGTHLHWTVKRFRKAPQATNATYDFKGKPYTLLNADNGLGGAFDPAELFEGQPMVKIIVEYHGMLGLMMITSGEFVSPVLWAKNWGHWQDILKQYEVPADAPKITLP